MHKLKLRSLSPRGNYTDQATTATAKLVPAFADRRYHVVSVTDPYGNTYGFLNRYNEMHRNIICRFFFTTVMKIKLEEMCFPFATLEDYNIVISGFYWTRL
jgi:hypothetical protein